MSLVRICSYLVVYSLHLKVTVTTQPKETKYKWRPWLLAWTQIKPPSQLQTFVIKSSSRDFITTSFIWHPKSLYEWLNDISISIRRAIFSGSQNICYLLCCSVCPSFIFMHQRASGRKHEIIRESILSVREHAAAATVFVCVCAKQLFSLSWFGCARNQRADQASAPEHKNRRRNPTRLRRVTRSWPMRQSTRKQGLLTL